MTYSEDLPYLNHILDAIKDIEESLKGLSKSQFLKNKDVKEANIRRLEIIGEAAKNISLSVKQEYTQIQWAKIVGTRDKMIHHYFGVDLDIVWEIIKKDIPLLKKQIQIIKEELEKTKNLI